MAQRSVFEPNNPHYMAESIQRVKDLFDRTGFEMYGILTWVNAMGDSRTVKILAPSVGFDRKPQISELTGDVARILGRKVNHGGVVVGGGGINALTEIGYALELKLGIKIPVREIADGV